MVIKNPNEVHAQTLYFVPFDLSRPTGEKVISVLEQNKKEDRRGMAFSFYIILITGIIFSVYFVIRYIKEDNASWLMVTGAVCVLILGYLLLLAPWKQEPSIRDKINTGEIRIVVTNVCYKLVNDIDANGTSSNNWYRVIVYNTTYGNDSVVLNTSNNYRKVAFSKKEAITFDAEDQKLVGENAAFIEYYDKKGKRYLLKLCCFLTNQKITGGYKNEE